MFVTKDEEGNIVPRQLTQVNLIFENYCVFMVQ